MVTLDCALRVPTYVLFANVGQEAVLLNTRTDEYYALNEVGARLWGLLDETKQLREIHQALLEEYEVASAQLEQDMLELVDHLLENGLVEILPG